MLVDRMPRQDTARLWIKTICAVLLIVLATTKINLMLFLMPLARCGQVPLKKSLETPV